MFLSPFFQYLTAKVMMLILERFIQVDFLRLLTITYRSLLVNHLWNIPRRRYPHRMTFVLIQLSNDPLHTCFQIYRSDLQMFPSSSGGWYITEKVFCLEFKISHVVEIKIWRLTVVQRVVILFPIDLFVPFFTIIRKERMIEDVVSSFGASE